MALRNNYPDPRVAASLDGLEDSRVKFSQASMLGCVVLLRCIVYVCLAQSRRLLVVLQ